MSLTNRFSIVLILLGLMFSINLVGQDSKENPLISSWKDYRDHKGNTIFNMQWIPLGPVVNSARAESVQGVPDQPGVYYAAFGSGNLWKTVNNGLSWKPIFEDQSALGIGDIALAPSNSNIIYLGSGESLKKARNFTMPGTGVFRSDDAGDTWQKTSANRNLRQRAWYYSRIYADTQNEDIVYVMNVAFWRSKDGGKTFTSLSTPHGDHHDLWIDPDNNQRMVVADDGGAQVSNDGGNNWTTYHNQPTSQGVAAKLKHIIRRCEFFRLHMNRFPNACTSGQDYRTIGPSRQSATALAAAD